MGSLPIALTSSDSLVTIAVSWVDSACAWLILKLDIRVEAIADVVSAAKLMELLDLVLNISFYTILTLFTFILLIYQNLVQTKF